ncbi:ABC transporter permease [Pseudonocardia sp.]|uniref:ABC transporter permease n=1 Tax=Pseudonocardia sp. TaxID=60912 RepID=UPI0031FD365D
MTAIAVELAPRAQQRRRLRRRFTRRPTAVIGLVGVVFFVLVAIVGPLISPADPNATNYDTIFVSPFSAGHLLGTDDLGRDVLSRLIVGTRASMEAGVLATLIAALVGVFLGLLSGYYRGWLDTVMMRATDVVLSFPFAILAVGLASILGPSLSNAILALAISLVPTFIRITRAEVLGLREQEYVQAAVVSGAPGLVIMFGHILRNCLTPLVVQVSVAIPGSIIGAATLSFLGLGEQPPTASWGTMLSESQNYLSQAAWFAVFPGLAIALATLSFTMLGDGLRDVLDPRGDR